MTLDKSVSVCLLKAFYTLQLKKCLNVNETCTLKRQIFKNGGRKEVTSYFIVKRFFFFCTSPAWHSVLVCVCVCLFERLLLKPMLALNFKILYQQFASLSEVDPTWYVKLSCPQKTS